MYTNLFPLVLLDKFLTLFKLQIEWLNLNLECIVILVELLLAILVYETYNLALVGVLQNLIKLLLFGEARLHHHIWDILASYSAKNFTAKLSYV